MIDLSRFTDAQRHSYSTALQEMREGRKRSHWMWYIFPQLSGLGHSPTAQYYSICDLDEAKAYLSDSVLGPRLLEISSVLLGNPSNDAQLVMGWPDCLKLKSCMTLFTAADPEEPVFQKVLEKFYGGERDELTLSLLLE